MRHEPLALRAALISETSTRIRTSHHAARSACDTAHMPATAEAKPTIRVVPRPSRTAWAVVGLLAAVATAGVLFHAFRFTEPTAGALTGRLENAFPKLPRFEYPLWFGHAGDGSGRL